MDTRGIFPNVGGEDDRNLIRALLQQPRAAAVEERLVRRFGVYFPLLLLLVACLSYISADRRTLLEISEFTFAMHMPHPASILLLVGFGLFPSSRWTFFLLSFLLMINLSTLWALHGERQMLPPSLGFFGFFASTTLFNLLFGLGMAAIARRMEPWFARGPLKPTLDVSQAATMFFVLLLLGVPLVLGMTQLLYAPLGLVYPADIGVLAVSQVVVVGIAATLCLVVVLHPPSIPSLIKISPVLLVFYAIAHVDKALGWQTEQVFTLFFAVALRFVLPVTTAISVTLCGLVLQRIALPDETMNWSSDYLIFAVLFATVTLFDLILLNGLSLDRRNARMQRKLMSSFEYSKFGYFLYSAKLQRFWIDELVRLSPYRIVSESSTETFRRMPTEDARRLAHILSTHSPEPRGLIVRLANGTVWEADKPYRVFRLHVVSETSSQYGLVSVGTVTDITDLHKASTSLEKTLKQLEISKEKQHRLFSLISHELRTPAAILKMLAEQMDEGHNWDELGPRFSTVLEQFLTLMDDLGSAVRDEDLLPANETTFQPNDFLQHLANVYRMMAEEAGISIDLRISPKFNERRLTDVGRLQQILGNLIRNSLYHSGGHHLTLSYRETRDENGGITGLWTIEDNGKGIPEKLLPGLFEPFNRETRGVFSEAEGTGLGMYIVKLFADTLHGDVRYEPREGGGARFIISLPLKPCSDTQPAEKSLDRGLVLKQTVLLVEDSPMVAEITRSQLRKTFHQVYHVESAELALERFETLAPDLVLTDVNLPKMNGLELTEKLRGNGYKGLIFGLSAAALDDREFLAKGANGMLSKPLPMRRLLSQLDQTEEIGDGPL